uniref:GG17390 n=1 Tax=Drosophila erecta TaxID=7220 RepID=B3P4L5_DROER
MQRPLVGLHQGAWRRMRLPCAWVNPGVGWSSYVIRPANPRAARSGFRRKVRARAAHPHPAQ